MYRPFPNTIDKMYIYRKKKKTCENNLKLCAQRQNNELFTERIVLEVAIVADEN